MGERGGGEIIRPDDVGAEETMPRLGVQVFDVAYRPDTAGVDDTVDAAELADRGSHGGTARGRIGHVAKDGPGVGSRLGRRVGQEVLPTCHQRDIRPPLCQADPDAAAQASGCADNHEPHAGVTLVGRELVDVTGPPGLRSEFDVECYSVPDHASTPWCPARGPVSPVSQ